MENKQEQIIPKNFSINEKYNVLFFIKNGSNAETYRVKGTDGKIYFLKLFNLAKINRTAFDNENNLQEIEMLKSIEHSCIVGFHDTGEIIFNGKKYIYLVLDFISGETLIDRIKREPFTSLYDIKQIAIAVLDGLNYLHNLPEPIIHNEITPENIMMDLSNDIPQPKIIDFGYARKFHQSTKSYNIEGLDLNYVASECFNNLYSPQSDIYSVGAIMYFLLYNYSPWYKSLSKFQSDRIDIQEAILEERKKKLIFNDLNDKIIDFDKSIVEIIEKALHHNPENRYNTANEFIQVLKGEIKIEELQITQKSDSTDLEEKEKISVGKNGKGFDAVSGMAELKNLLTVDVINALKNPEEYKRYGISFPNGILFYGPPRCGKTFFAKKFAEEVGYNYIYKKPSDLKSKYINATQENIAKMFEEAEKNAPTIIFMDEINEIVPNRDGDVHEMAKSAVNEMLAQMDRTGEKGIFVIGATNYPHMIDPAILGAGRLEKKFYISPPDFELRRSLFENYLKNKPLDLGIDYDKLSNLTVNYVTGDIELLINEAAKKAMISKQRITMQILEETIKNQKPTVSITELKKYEEIRRKIEDQS